jgi:hypothetical protein
MSLNLVAVLMIGGCMALAVIGLLATRQPVGRQLSEGHNDIAGFLFTTVGVLYSILLAFIVFVVWQQFSSADLAVTQEAAMTVTVFRDTQRFPPADEQRAQTALRDYVKEVVTSEWASHGTLRPHTTPDPLNAVWQVYWGLPAAAQAAPWYPGALDRLHALEDLRHTRHLSGEATLPPVFWVILILGAVVTIGFTYFLHLGNIRVHAAMTAVLAAGVGAILFLLVALDRPFTGQVHVSQQPFQHALLQFDALDRGMPQHP